MNAMLTIRIDWDEAARLWIAESLEIPGLFTEADTVERLIANVEALVPDLLELNGGEGSGMPYRVLMERHFQPCVRH